MRNGVAGGNTWNSGINNPSRPAVIGTGPVPRSRLLMLVTSSPHSVCAFSSWLNPSLEMLMARSYGW